MVGDRPRLPANRKCYKLSRVSWALAQISCYCCMYCWQWHFQTASCVVARKCRKKFFLLEIFLVKVCKMWRYNFILKKLRSKIEIFSTQYFPSDILQLSVGILSEIWSVCRIIATFCPAHFFTHDHAHDATGQCLTCVLQLPLFGSNRRETSCRCCGDYRCPLFSTTGNVCEVFELRPRTG